ncbi:cytochrome P450 [Xylariaceae sp. AK1471]|nr:cytochrome P450 [Xylariaceae sp. AK1471]
MALVNQDHLPAIVCLLLVGWYLTSTIYSWYRLRHLPGPLLASLSYLWVANVSWRGTQYETYRSLSEKYGSIVRVGPNELITDDPEVLRRISSTKNEYSRSEWYNGARINPHTVTMINLLDPLSHDNAKVKLSPGYSGRETPGLESIVDQQLASLVNLIRRKYIHNPQNGKGFVALELTRVIPLFTLDVISHVALGQGFGCLEADTDIHGFYHTLETSLPQISMIADVPWMRRVLLSRLALSLLGPKETDRTGLGKLMKVTNDEVRKRYGPDATDQMDLLGSFVRHGLTQKVCEAEGLFMFLAGSDTTANALRLTMLYIMTTPLVYRKLKDEIAAAIRDGKASRPITSAEARGLPYLQAVIHEGLRMRPVLTQVFSKEVPPEGDTIGGHFIPGGTAIGMNLSSMLCSKALFGDDAEIFRPERFLEASEATRLEMQRNVDLNFGYGRWMCSGRPLAWTELNKTYFELLREFDFQVGDPKVAMNSRSYGLFLDKGLFVRVTESTLGA